MKHLLEIVPSKCALSVAPDPSNLDNELREPPNARRQADTTKRKRGMYPEAI